MIIILYFIKNKRTLILSNTNNFKELIAQILKKRCKRAKKKLNINMQRNHIDFIHRYNFGNRSYYMVIVWL